MTNGSSPSGKPWDNCCPQCSGATAATADPEIMRAIELSRLAMVDRMMNSNNGHCPWFPVFLTASFGFGFPSRPTPSPSHAGQSRNLFSIRVVARAMVKEGIDSTTRKRYFQQSYFVAKHGERRPRLIMNMFPNVPCANE